jgi:hypothetical protein
VDARVLMMILVKTVTTARREKDGAKAKEATAVAKMMVQMRDVAREKDGERVIINLAKAHKNDNE